MINIFQNDFCGAEKFVKQVLNPIFGNECFESIRDNLLKTDEAKNIAKNANIIKVEQVGNINAIYADGIQLYDVTLKDNSKISRSRVGIQQLIRSSMLTYSHAFILFHYENVAGRSWRFSYAYKESTQAGMTSAKRFTYLLGKKYSCRTAEERFGKLIGQVEITDEMLLDAFSVEALSKDFYTKLFNWYNWATSEKSGVTFPNNTDRDDDDRDNINVKIIRMITRILFVWFIKQKGLVPDKIFDEKELQKILKDFKPNSLDNGDYYNAILQNLFFATLNRAIVDDEGNPRRFANLKDKRDLRNLYRYAEMFILSENEIIELFSKVPFLNGGLFECLDKFKKTGIMQDSDVYLDGFSRNVTRSSNGNYRYRAFVPNTLFFNDDESQPGLINLFKQFNFTIEENSPNDAQISLDPELLGRVFENLLAAYNPETQESARKSTGSFYTPREIVDYMVDESLMAHLLQHCPDLKEPTIRNLFAAHIRPAEWTEKQCEQAVAEIKSIKILDPACGSGAFPMGCLLRMVEIIELLQSEKEDRYTLKLHLIENCIYGIDIQPIAMLISKLRFFISLICEQHDIDFTKPEENFGINTLPNLETKFVAANTLIAANIRNFDGDWTNNEELVKLKNELLQIRHEHFFARSQYKKSKNREADEAKRDEILAFIVKNTSNPFTLRLSKLSECIERYKTELLKYKDENFIDEWVQPQTTLFETHAPTLFRRDINKEKREEINKKIKACQNEIDAEKNKSAPSEFDAAVKQITQWNPYDQNATSPFFDPDWMFGVTTGFDIVIGNPPYVQLQNNGGALAKEIEGQKYKTFARTGDIYCCFYERGVQLLKPEAHLCFITSNKWMRAGYGEATRKFFAENTNPLQLIDFAGVKIFESATVDTNILLLQKSKNQGQTLACVTKVADCKNNLSVFFQQQYSLCSFQTSDSWVVLSPIEQRIKQKIEAVGTPLKDWDINIYRGVLTGCNEAFIISGDKRNEILANCKTKEERTKTAELIRPILRGRDIKRYGYDFADLYLINTHNGVKDKGIKRIDVNDYPAVKAHLDSYWKQIEKRADQGDTPYNLRNCAYMEDFSKQKIVWKRVGSILRFSYDETGCLALDSTCFATGKDIAFLVAVLNSPMGHYLLKDAPKTGTGDLLISVQAVEPILIPIPNNRSDLITMANELVKDYSEKKENVFNKLVYSLYKLSSEEIDFIENREV